MRFIHGHGRRRAKPYVETDCGYETLCWIYEGQPSRRYPAIATTDGYDSVHRVMYEREVGPIPAGFHVHHRCLQARCMNPAHLVALPAREHLELPRPHVRRYSNERLAELHARHESGESQVSLARELGIAQTGVSVLLRRYRREVLSTQ